MSPPILYLVTTKSSAMVCSCCSSSDIFTAALQATYSPIFLSGKISHACKLDTAALGPASTLHDAAHMVFASRSTVPPNIPECIVVCFVVPYCPTCPMQSKAEILVYTVKSEIKEMRNLFIHTEKTSVTYKA